MDRRAAALLIAFLVILGRTSISQSAPFTLPTNDIAILSYTGYENRHAAPGNATIGVGDVFEGVIQFQTLRNATGSVDLSSQFADMELTGRFQFQVIGGGPNNHLEFGAGQFRLFVGSGAARNFDGSALDAVGRATDGQLWLSVSPGGFFESVNDPFNGAPRNRAWLDVTENLTGYALGHVAFPTVLGKDPTHIWQGAIHGDHPVQAYFEDFPGPSDLPQYSFKIHGDVFLYAVPEPGTVGLLISGLIFLARYLKPKSNVSC